MTQQESFLCDLESEKIPYRAYQESGGDFTVIVNPDAPKDKDTWIAFFDSSGNFLSAME